MGKCNTLVAILLLASVICVAEAKAQSSPAQTQPPPAGQSPEKMVQGQVKSIHPAGTELTLTDGTRLVAPAGATIKPGIITEGVTVIASYREENGDKVMTELTVQKPSGSPPSGSPPSASPPADPRLPAQPSPAPPPASPRRY